ncbi:MAG: ECF-type sigma factor [Planctomycetota bacterium]|nr:ECF-type sigma factor [Planctomycetota bacterium]
MTEVTQILRRIELGESVAAEQLLPLVYRELRQLAAARMAEERPGNTLQPTALVHEAWLRLVNVEQAQRWDSRGHFFAAAAEAMRRILIDAARRKGSLKHGGGKVRLDLEDLPAAAPSEDLLALDEALHRLAERDAVKAELVKLRFFGGLSMPEAAATLGISLTAAERHWAFARTWLFAELKEPEEKAADS